MIRSKAKPKAAYLKKRRSELQIFLTQTAAACLLAVLFALALQAAAAFLVVQFQLDHRYFSAVACAAGSISVLLACLVAARRRGRDGLLLGAATAGALFLLLLFASSVSGNLQMDGQLVSKFAGLLSAGCLGGILGVNRKKKSPVPEA